MPFIILCVCIPTKNTLQAVGQVMAWSVQGCKTLWDGVDCVGPRKPNRVQLHPYSFLKVVPEVKNLLNHVHAFLKTAGGCLLKRSLGMS